MNQFLLLAVPLALLAVGCGKSGGSSSTSQTSAPITAEVRETFKGRCGVCHGEQGRGDGPGGVALTPKPRNFTDPSWQRTVKDDDIKKTIVMGGAAVGKSPAMPASPDLEAQPEMLAGLVAVVRDFKR